MSRHNYKSSAVSPKYVFIALIFITTGLLIYRLFYLQILHQTDFRLQSDQNRIREIIIKPLRGLIYDRNGKLLVGNQPAFSLYALPYELRQDPSLYERLAEFLGTTPDKIKKRIRRNMRGYFRPVRLAREVNFRLVSHIEEFRMDYPGIGFWVEPVRSYPSEVRAAHLLGYISEISSKELERYGEDYQPGDVVGKKGIERTYEHLLRGKAGVKYVEVDAFGREVRTLDHPHPEEAVPGDNLYLTLDLELQALAEKLMEGQRGSIILQDLRDGGILTMVSKPDYDPRMLSGIIRPQVWRELLADPEDPLYDRTIQSLYPPGSTYKLVLALAALTTKTITPKWSAFCSGAYRLGRRYFKCWNSKGHGRLDLLHAIEQSCNVYFYQLGLKTGLENWSKFSKLLQFGHKTGIDLPLENQGVVPDKELLDRQYGKGKWTKGLLLNLSVGQGDLLVTPIQMLRFASILGRKGLYYRPHLLHHAINPMTGETFYFKPDSSHVEGIPEEVFDIVREGMRLVVQGKHGTGKAARVPGMEVGGKTGTAQNPHGKDHAWFIGFAPFENPRVAIVVLVENGGGGGAVAAPKAGALFRKYFEKYPIDATTLAQGR